MSATVDGARAVDLDLVGGHWPDDEFEGTATMLVLAKSPVAGRVKTRLHERYTPLQAAALARAALIDTLATVRTHPARRKVLVLEGEAGPWVGPGFELMGQVEGGLDERIAAAFEAVLPHDGPALLIGMDTPQVDLALLDVDWTGVDAVLGLSEDGGYWAIGLREAHPLAFRGIPMSTPTTGARQLERLRSLGLRVRLLPTVRDVDTPVDADLVAASAPGTEFARALARCTHPTTALALYEEALEGASVNAEGIHARYLDVRRWQGSPDRADRMVLARCEAPVLDIGCGPGRLVAELAGSGVAALGIDVSPVAVAMTAARGACVLRRPVQATLPGEGRWGTALLIDGNIGIGGRPDALLGRCAELVRPGGLVLVEADAEAGTEDHEAVVLIAEDGRRAHPVPWARLGVLALAACAQRSGLSVSDSWESDGRVFLALRLPPAAEHYDGTLPAGSGAGAPGPPRPLRRDIAICTAATSATPEAMAT